MARRTQIVVSPAVGQYTTSETVIAERVANWRSRGLAPLEFTEPQLADMRYLRKCKIEFSAYTLNIRFIPPGYGIEDLLRLFVAREPPILLENNLHLKMTARQIIQIRDTLTVQAETLSKQEEALNKQGVALSKQMQRLQDAEAKLYNHQAQIEAWTEEVTYDDDGPDQPTEDLDPSSAGPMQEPVVDESHQDIPAEAIPSSRNTPLLDSRFDGLPHIAGFPEWQVGGSQLQQ